MSVHDIQTFFSRRDGTAPANRGSFMTRIAGYIKKLTIIAALTLTSSILHAQEAVLYTFSNNSVSTGPNSSLVMDSKGNLYGTTSMGFPDGSVFELTPVAGGGWTEQTIFTFPESPEDGKIPMGGVILDKEGNLYGTTENGGDHGDGTVYELSPNADGVWSEKTLYSFGEIAEDGRQPEAGLIFDSSGNLYGTTIYGGNDPSGTVFELIRKPNDTWTEDVIWRFAGTSSDGCEPQSGLAIDAKGDLFGTTVGCGTDHVGAVFELMPQSGGGWTESILHNFCPAATCDDGYMPQADLIFDKKGNLYGTTPYGGKYGSSNGAVFMLSPGADGAWTESTIHSFHGSAGDGTFPVDRLIFDSKGNLFGTTEFGGKAFAGIVFELLPSDSGTWTERVAYNFGLSSKTGGRAPVAGLILDTAGNLYGTASEGGVDNAGTAFEIFNPNRTGTPQFSISSGKYTSVQMVAITDYTPHAAIYYTTDDEAPTTASERYTEPVKVTKSETFKAIAVAAGLEDSLVGSASYSIELPAAKPKLSLPAGVYNKVETVTITDTTSNAVIYYTTNGQTPTTASTKYIRPIEISSSETLKVMAIARGGSPSPIAEAVYTIHLPGTAAPQILPKTGSYTGSVTLKITDATADALIYYTTNGDTPKPVSTEYYRGGVIISKSETVKAIAVAPGHAVSSVVSASFTIQ